MKHIALIVCIFITSRALGQVDDPPYTKMSLEVLAPLNFNYTSAQDLLSPKVISNALKITMKVKQEHTLVMAQLAFNNVNEAFYNKMAMVMTGSTSTNLGNSTGDKILGQQPVVLFTQPRSEKGTKHYEYLFNLKLNPPQTFTGIGNSNFAITFTLSMQ